MMDVMKIEKKIVKKGVRKTKSKFEIKPDLLTFFLTTLLVVWQGMLKFSLIKKDTPLGKC